CPFLALRRVTLVFRNRPALTGRTLLNRKVGARRVDAATEESGHCDPRHGSGTSAGGDPGVAGERESEEEGHERAQTAAQASRARTAARVEDADAQRHGATTGIEEEQAARTGYVTHGGGQDHVIWLSVHY